MPQSPQSSVRIALFLGPSYLGTSFGPLPETLILSPASPGQTLNPKPLWCEVPKALKPRRLKPSQPLSPKPLPCTCISPCFSGFGEGLRSRVFRGLKGIYRALIPSFPTKNQGAFGSKGLDFRFGLLGCLGSRPQGCLMFRV